MTTVDPMERLARTLKRYTPEKLRAVIETLEDRDVAILERCIADLTKSGWRSSPYAMGHQFGDLAPMAHTQFLSDRFVDAVDGVDPFQIWNVPAQHGKSLIASRWGPVWALDRDPSTNLILASYAFTLARENALFVRDQLVEHGDVLATRLRRDVRRADRLKTDDGGGILAAGAGGSIIGFGARVIIIDDPFKNWVEAHSETTRESIWNWYRSTIVGRLHDRPDVPGSIILVMTRWHEDDLTGRLVDQSERDWNLIRLPAIAELDDPLGRKPGEALAPLLYDIRALRARAAEMGSYLTAGMEQQRPAPEEGTEVKRSWWRWFDTPPPRFDDATTSWDMKLKDTETGDFVVGQAWGRTGSDFWLLDQLRGQWNQTTAKTAIVLLSVRHPRIRRHVIENTGNGPEVMAELRRPQPGYSVSEETRSLLGITDDEIEQVNRVFRRGMTGLTPETVKGKKTVRFRAQTPLIEAGNVHVPNGPTGESVVNEAAMFPNGTHDDQVDTLSQALKRLSGGGGTATAPKGQVQSPAPGARAGRPGAPATGGVPARVRRGPNSLIRRR